MSNDNLDLPHLVQVCEAATKCQWQSQGVRVEPLDAPRYEINDGWIICDCEGPDGAWNAAFIATFSPPTVLALLRRLGEAEERVRQLESGYTERQSSIRCNKCGSAMHFTIIGASLKSEDKAT